MPLAFSLPVHAAAFAALAAVSAGLVYAMLKRVRILDVPNGRSSHVKAVPRSGGIAIALALLGGLALYALGAGDTQAAALLTALAVVALAAVVDDVKGLGFRGKLVGQTAAAVVVLAAGDVVARLLVPGLGVVELGAAGLLLTLVWVVGVTNAFNFMDGLDGLAGGTAVIAGLFLAAIALVLGAPFVYVAGAALAAAAAGFLVFNFPPARIFMGDTGSQTLGFALAALGVVLARDDASGTLVLVVPVLLFNFLWDTSFTLMRRLARGENLAQAHREHLYQLLNRAGYSHRQVTLLHYAVSGLQGLAALAMLGYPEAVRPLVFVPLGLVQAAYTAFVLAKARRAGLI